MRDRTAICRLLIGALAVGGVVVKCELLTADPQVWLLSYFTILTNLMTGIWFLLEGAIPALGKRLGQMKGGLLLCNLLTGCVYYLVLHPGTFGLGAVLSINGLQHFVIPVCVLLDWIVLEKRGTYRWWSPVLWSLAPLGYVFFIETAVPAGLCIGRFRIGYPYFFLDPGRVGVSGVIRYTIGLGAAWLAAGYLLVWIDRMLARRHE